MVQQRILLAIFAHPSAESYSAAGTLATYASQGVEVRLISATKGEAGMISSPELAFRDNLGAVREEELREACRVMGIHQPNMLGYRDSGIAGTKENLDPQSLNMASPEEVIGKIVYLIRQIRPNVIISYDHQVVFGHPDHVAVSKYTKEAFEASGDPSRYPEHITKDVKPHTPHRLFYVTIPQSRIEALAKVIPSDLRPDDEEIDVKDIGAPDEHITVEMDTSAMYDTKCKVIACHRTQQRPKDFFNRLPEDVRRNIFSREHFTQVLPALQEGTQYKDLFEGLEFGSLSS